VNIEQIALEVAKEHLHLLLDSKFGHPEYTSVMASAPQLFTFVKAFLARVRKEEAKAGAVAWLFTGNYTKQAFAIRESAEAYARGLLTTDPEGGYEVKPLYLSPTLPEGWKAVPVDPTTAMLKAGELESDSETATYETVFTAMLAAAPEVPK